MPRQSVSPDSITLRLKRQAGSSNTPTVALFGGSNGGPSGPAFVGFDTLSIPIVAGDVTFRPRDHILFTSNTTCWPKPNTVELRADVHQSPTEE